MFSFIYSRSTIGKSMIDPMSLKNLGFLVINESAIIIVILTVNNFQSFIAALSKPLHMKHIV